MLRKPIDDAVRPVVDPARARPLASGVLPPAVLVNGYPTAARKCEDLSFFGFDAVNSPARRYRAARSRAKEDLIHARRMLDSWWLSLPQFTSRAANRTALPANHASPEYPTTGTPSDQASYADRSSKLSPERSMSGGKCWAESLGGCAGPITQEHLASKSLFEKRIRVEGGLLGPPGVETSIKKLTANILCQKHNSELGRTADAAALQLYRHLQSSHQPMALPGSRIMRPPVEKRETGVNFGRWLCKTHCNFMVAQAMTPDPAYVRYAFLQPPAKPIYFYFAGGEGEPLRLADGRDPVVTWYQFLVEDSPGLDAFLISLAGFRMIVTTVPIMRNGLRMVDRIRVLQLQTSLGPFRIVIDWTGEPAGSVPTAV